ncbi:MAG: hypothetical protein Q8O05_05190 [Chloroflexota bacterium]|nr:hypothetical protein [Chloroflexota bacterium]
MFTEDEYSFCDFCYVEAPTKYITLHQTIGVVFMWSRRKQKANLCRSCLNKHFWEFTLTSLFLGWWSPPSLVWMFYCIPANIVRYVGARDLRGVPKGAPVLNLSDDIIKRLLPFRRELYDKLNMHQPLIYVAKDIADKAGVRVGHVIIYLRISNKIEPHQLGPLSQCPFCNGKNVLNDLETRQNKSKDDRLNDGYYAKWACSCKDCGNIWNSVSTTELEETEPVHQYRHF